MSELARCRQSIDAIDGQILTLLNQRAELAMAIGREKAKSGANLRDPKREHEIQQRLTRLHNGPFPLESLLAIYREIFAASLSLEKPITIAYLGPQATFTHLACIQQFGYSAHYLPLDTIEEVFHTVERDGAEYGVVPVENSTEGVVSHTLDMFVESPLRICAEILQEITHHLVSLAGELKEIREISSHPQALAQCRCWLETNLPGVPRREVSSTAKAAELAAQDPTVAAIASEPAALLHGLKVLVRRIEDNIQNVTRFLVIGKRTAPRSERDKTSLLVSIKDEAGALYHLLEPFARHRMNLTKIESRPLKKRPWEYLFFMDVEGHQEDETLKAVLDVICGKCLFVKVLGSYRHQLRQDGRELFP